MNNLSMLLLFIICTIKKCYNISKRYISIPFNVQQERVYTSQDYNSEIFIKNNFYKNITYNFYIGNPPKKVDGIISNDNLCFEMKLLEDLDIDKDYIKSTNNKYFPKDSSSFSLTHKELRWTKGQYMTLGSDLFNFNSEKNYNLSFLLHKTDDENFDFNSVRNRKYIIKFGLNIQTSFTGDECPNFIIYTRGKAALSKYLFSYIFKNSQEGLLIIGDELYNYNPRIYNQSHFTGVYNFNHNSLNHDKVIIFDKNNDQYITLNKSNAFIDYKYGIIIGTSQYKQLIDQFFFSKLINGNICKERLVNLNDTSKYYIYICNKNINLLTFPKLVFFSRNYKYNFELDSQDLFIKKFDNNFYFLVIFRQNADDNDDWILGEPFYKKYTFSFNLDARIVGFYDKIFPDEKNNEETIENNNESNNTMKIILIIICCLILIALLMFLSFYYGMKLKEGRKKRANELKEDNYEYFPESDKENNKIIN